MPIAKESKPFPLLIKIKSTKSNNIKPPQKKSTDFFIRLCGITKYIK